MLEQIVKTAYKEFTLRFYARAVRALPGSGDRPDRGGDLRRGGHPGPLGSPTVNEFADFMHVSTTPNADLQDQQPCAQGVRRKDPFGPGTSGSTCSTSPRNTRLTAARATACRALWPRIRERFSPEECAKFGEMLSVISEELLPFDGEQPAGPDRPAQNRQ